MRSPLRALVVAAAATSFAQPAALSQTPGRLGSHYTSATTHAPLYDVTSFQLDPSFRPLSATRPSGGLLFIRFRSIDLLGNEPFGDTTIEMVAPARSSAIGQADELAPVAHATTNNPPDIDVGKSTRSKRA